MPRFLVFSLAAALVVFALVGLALGADETHNGFVVRAGDGKLVMTDEHGANERTYSVSNTTMISLDGKPAELTDLLRGFTVTVTLDVQPKGTLVKSIEGVSPR